MTIEKLYELNDVGFYVDMDETKRGDHISIHFEG